MNRLIRIVVATLLTILSVSAMADDSLVKLKAWPSVSVADGRSTITITADVYDVNGKRAGNGTQVVFFTTLGTFREASVKTTNGIAQATLIAGAVPGVARISASSAGGQGNPSVLEYRFVTSRDELSSSREYIEIVAPGYMQYAPISKTLGAAAPNKGVKLSYREVLIEADDLQINVPAYTVKARRARLTIGKFVKTFDELNFRLDQRTGTGTTMFAVGAPDTVVPYGRGLLMLKKMGEDSYVRPNSGERFGYVEVNREGVKPLMEVASPDTFEFADLSSAPNTISAKKAVIYPTKEIQFQRAELFVANAKVIKLPLYVVSMFNTQNDFLTGDLVSVNDNQVSLNYPYYLSLKPGMTSLIRFRTGERLGRGFATNRGAFADYELSWNKGDNQDGSLIVSGLGRDDWNISGRQSVSFGNNSTLFAQFEIPASTSIVGSAFFQKVFRGGTMSLNTSQSQSLRGLSYRTQNYGVVLEKDPVKLGKLPARTFLGITANQNVNSDSVNGTRRESTLGLSLRTISDSLRIDKLSSLTASFTVTKPFSNRQQSAATGINSNGQLALASTITVSRNFSPSSTLLVTYDFLQDGFNDRVLGSHRVSSQLSFRAGKLSSSLLVNRTLASPRLGVFADARYSFSKNWNLGYQYTFDRFTSGEFLDYNFLFTYRLGNDSIGYKDIGLTWSKRTQRIGLQLFGTSF